MYHNMNSVLFLSSIVFFLFMTLLTNSTLNVGTTIFYLLLGSTILYCNLPCAMRTAGILILILIWSPIFRSSTTSFILRNLYLNILLSVNSS